MVDIIRESGGRSIDKEKAFRFIEELESSQPMKPWTLISRVRDEDEEHHDLRVNVLKPLTLEGYITPNADGDLYVDKRMDFRDDYNV